MSQSRGLAAILAANVARYSRLMGTDEEGTLERLKALRHELVDPKIAEHHGRIPELDSGTKTTGTACWHPGGDHGPISASNPGAAVPAGQIEKLALDVGEQTWRKEAVGENPRPTRYGLKASIWPLVDIMLGDDDPTRFVVQPDRALDAFRHPYAYAARQGLLAEPAQGEPVYA